jgi:Skp family chaperone for outer membrane proteins
VPAVVVVTAAFANLAQTAAQARGYASLPMLVLPHPLETRSAAAVRRLAAQRADELARLLAEP